jgi:hypothetical protein
MVSVIVRLMRLLGALALLCCACGDGSPNSAYGMLQDDDGGMVELGPMCMVADGCPSGGTCCGTLCCSQSQTCCFNNGAASCQGMSLNGDICSGGSTFGP